MYLDPRTLTVVAIVVCMLLGPVSLAFGLRHKGLQAALLWGGALLLLAAGLVTQSLRPMLGDAIGHAVVYGFLAAAALATAQAARALAGLPRRDVPGMVLAGLLVLAMLAWGAPEFEPVRAYAGTGVLAVLMFRAGYAFDRAAAPQDAEPARATACLAGIVGLGLLLDATGTALNLRRSDPGISGYADAMLMVGFIATLVGATLSMMWMLTGRLSLTLRRLSTRDVLTGTLNRAAFMRAHGRELARARRRSDSRYALVLFDVDNLGRINDAFGHAAGDRVMRAVVAPLPGLLREYDIVGRLDGDEIGLLLPGTLAEGARTSAERVRAAIEKQGAMASGLRVPVTVSAGVAIHGEDGEDWDALMASASAALRVAKESGRNRTVMASGLAAVQAPGRVAAVEPKDPFAAFGQLVDLPRPVGG